MKLLEVIIAGVVLIAAWNLIPDYIKEWKKEWKEADQKKQSRILSECLDKSKEGLPKTSAVYWTQAQRNQSGDQYVQCLKQHHYHP